MIRVWVSMANITGEESPRMRRVKIGSKSDMCDWLASWVARTKECEGAVLAWACGFHKLLMPIIGRAMRSGSKVRSRLGSRVGIDAAFGNLRSES